MIYICHQKKMFKRVSLLLTILFISQYTSLIAINSFAAEPAPVTDVFNGGRGITFNDNWRFHLGDASGANLPGYNDSSWRQLSLPHDWSIELDFNQNSLAGGGGGYLDGGIGWYRKTFLLPDSDAGKRITIQFEGIYMNSSVYVNGQLLGTRPYGYSTFEYDLTPYLNTGSNTNVIAVKVNNNQPNSRWYSGSGIYRNVWLTVTDPVHIAYCGTFAYSSSVSSSSAKITVKTNVQNHSSISQNVSIVSTIYDRDGNGVAANTSAPFNLDSNSETSVAYNLNIANPNLWAPANPYLYNIKTRLIINKKIVDTFVSTLGVRSITLDPNTGLWINNTNIKLHGVCMHHDLGSLGSAQNYRALERQVEILKSFGCNAIRTSHNPPAPELSDICDRLGLVVMDESFDCWETGKNTNDYGLYFDTWAQQDVQDWIRRDRNHPSVVMWSIGNEIPQQGDAKGYTIAQNLIRWVHADDTSRPITQALNYEALIGPLLSIVGYNYASGGTYDNDHKSNPQWVIMGSETSSAVRTRGIYHLPANQNNLTSSDMQCSSYDNSVVPWGHSAEDSWEFDKTRPFVVGQFIWTGFDYIGEPTPYGWPAKSSYFGIVDMCGFPKDIYYFYQSQWTAKPMVHLLPHWNWSPGDTIPVWAYSNCDSVSLFINGVSSGTSRIQTVKPYHVEWKIPFTSGKINAIAYKNGSIAAKDSVITADAPSKIGLKSDRDTIQADGVDQAFLETDILDVNGSLNPFADNQINYSITGPGRIVSVDNGNPLSLEPFKATKRQAFNGKCLAIVQSTGTEGQIVVTAGTSPVLKNIALNKPAHADSEDIYTLSDIAIGKTSTSDSEQSWNPTSAGNDGNNGTRWCANDGNAGHWWKVDLGSNHSITGTEIIWEHTNAYQYKIETSSDNSTWKLSVNKTGNQSSAQIMDDNFSDLVRYIRITITGGVNSSNWASFFEFRVFDGSFTVGTQRNVASKANDGSLDTFWSAADGNSGHFWIVNLGSNYNLIRSQVVWLNSGIAYQYKIETSKDSVAWSKVIDKTSNTTTLQMQTDSFNVTAKYVKVTITGGTSVTNKAGLLEFRVFDGTLINFNPASVSINCIKPLCKSCISDSVSVNPIVNINNSGWQQSGTALICAGGNVSFSTSAGDTTGWQWYGPNGYSANKMQINLYNIGQAQAGIYKVSHQNRFFNFQLNLINDSLSTFVKVNNDPFTLTDNATAFIGDTVVFNPFPADSVGWNWSWTGPDAFSSSSRVLKIAITDSHQNGTYTVTCADALGCTNIQKKFTLIINEKTELSNVRIYPNPSNSGIFNFENCAGFKVSVYNLIGKMIYNNFVISNFQVVDLSRQSRGVYIVKIFSDKANSNNKIVIQ
jgi:beta-galactosidase